MIFSVARSVALYCAPWSVTLLEILCATETSHGESQPLKRGATQTRYVTLPPVFS